MPASIAIFSYREPGFSWPLTAMADECERRGWSVVTYGINIRPQEVAVADRPFSVGYWWDLETIHEQYNLALQCIREHQPELVIAPQLMVGVRAATRDCGVPHATFGMGSLDFPGTTLYACGLLAFEDAKRHRLSPESYREALNRLAKSMDPSTGWRNACDSRELFGESVLVRGPKGRYGALSEVKMVEIGAALSEPFGMTERFLNCFEPIAGKSTYAVFYGKTFGYTNTLQVLFDVLSRKKARVLVDTARLDFPVSDGLNALPTVPFGALAHLGAVMITNGHTASCLAAYKYQLRTLFLPSGSGTNELASEYSTLLPGRTQILARQDCSELNISNAIRDLAELPEGPVVDIEGEDDWTSIAVDGLGL